MNALRYFLLCASIALVFTSCKSLEPENLSERPWNAQQGWQTGLPSTINQGR
jgi:hypothetical protein